MKDGKVSKAGRGDLERFGLDPSHQTANVPKMIPSGNSIVGVICRNFGINTPNKTLNPITQAVPSQIAAALDLSCGFMIFVGSIRCAASFGRVSHSGIFVVN